MTEARTVAQLHVPVTFPRAAGQSIPDAVPGKFEMCRGALCVFGQLSNLSSPGYPETVGFLYDSGTMQLGIAASQIDGQYDIDASWYDGVSGEVEQLTYQPSSSAMAITIFTGPVDYRATSQGCVSFLFGEVTLTQPVSLVAADALGPGGAAGAAGAAGAGQ